MEERTRHRGAKDSKDSGEVVVYPRIRVLSHRDGWADCPARRHKDLRTLALCIFDWGRMPEDKAEWVVGEGEWATLAWCRVLTVTLWPTFEKAASALATIEGGCGGYCHQDHEIVRLVH